MGRSVIPEYLDRNCMIYQHDCVTFLSTLSPESVQLIWASPPYDVNEPPGPLKSVAQMEATELCAAVADAAAKILAADGVLIVYPLHRDTRGVISAIIKRTPLQFGVALTVPSSLENDVIVFHKGEPKFYGGYPPLVPQEFQETVATILEAHTDEGDIVVDPFCGSGYVMEAAIKVGCLALVNDSDARAVQTTIDRYKERCA